ncbi:MAG: diguanylate cyclase [Treponema sp.]|jgi:diguanylate cyclase (GGDEF)-like protein|nr:diguanylate cyclase [Treponema sp.]
MTAVNVDSALIKKTELFSGLTQEKLDFVVCHSGILSLSKGKPLFSSREEAKHFYILTEGAIRVYKNRDDGGEDEMALFTVGDTIGDFDFARSAEYDACAEAAEDSKLIEFPVCGHTIDTLAEKDPDAVCSILLNAIILITRRIKSANKLLLDNMSWVQELHNRVYEDAGTGLWKQTLINDEISNALIHPAALIMLKPDRFKILVDSRGHSAGDEAMIRIAIILKNITRQLGHGWPIRFKSNETGLIINNCDHSMAEQIAKELYDAIAGLEPVPAKNEIPEFHFTATICWAVWTKNDSDWDNFLNGTYTTLMENWRAGGERIIQYNGMEKQ